MAAGGGAAGVNMQVAQLLSAGAFDRLAPLLEDLELQVPEPFLPSSWPYATQLLGYIYSHRLEDARFLWRRVPDEQRKAPELQSAVALLQALWNKDYEGTWAALRDGAWSPAVEPLAAAAGRGARARTLALLRRAYSALPPPRAAALLGLPEADIVAFMLGEGWSRDPATGMLSCGAAEDDAVLPTEAEHLERLSQYMMHVEADPEPESDTADTWQAA